MGAEFEPDEPFVEAAQQRETARIGTWAFLASESMMFGALLMVAWYLRSLHGEAVSVAVGHLHYALAGFNSLLLLTSCLAMTLALHAARDGYEATLRGWLLCAALLAAAFLGIKGYEYFSEYREGLLPWQDASLPPAGRLFINLYVLATGLHGLHVLIALLGALLLWLRSARGRLPVPRRLSLVEGFVHYWHLVDVIWILLYPTLYLVGRSS